MNRKVSELFRRSGADSWYTPESDAVLPAGTKCTHCACMAFKKEMDIFDVWLESGASYLALRAAEPAYPWPASLYLEGADQFRGWFQSSLLCAMGNESTPPYAGVVTPGWTLDEKGQAMSKSRGNDVDPVDIAKKDGGEIVRMWVASVDFREDMVGSDALMKRAGENYRTIRNNLFRFVLGNLYDFDSSHAVPFEKLEAIDQYMLRETAALTADVLRWYEEFAFHKIYQRINHFCVVELSAFYFDIVKDRLYTYAPANAARRTAQTVLWRIGEALVRLLAPILSFTSEEVWQYLPKMDSRAPSVHLEKFPTVDYVLDGGALEDAAQSEDWKTLRGIREQVLKSLEEARNQKLIGKALEAKIALTAADPVYPVLERYKEQLRYLFIVSHVSLQKAASGNGSSAVSVHVDKADGQKCERCWNYSTRVGEDKDYPTVCERCSAAIKEIEGK
ncbi:MAG TPA: class I tRNA ligase family protein [Terriglobales bacterium]|nr:class I tRNA ligase family protein [Terriglobales bacterium]